MRVRFVQTYTYQGLSAAGGGGGLSSSARSTLPALRQVQAICYIAMNGNKHRSKNINNYHLRTRNEINWI